MRTGDDLIKTFARCFRLFAKLNAGIKDGFFVGLISKESENLLSGYLEFLKIRGDTIAKNHDMKQHDFRVAQYHYRELNFRINSIILLLDIFKHLNLTEITTPLLLERELLKLKLLLLNDNEQFLTIRVREAKVGSILKNKQKSKNLKKSEKPQELGEAHKQIAEFVRSKERVQNVEVFSQFADTTRRTLKRKLSELVKAGAIQRLPLGKKVFYTVLTENQQGTNKK